MATTNKKPTTNNVTNFMLTEEPIKANDASIEEQHKLKIIEETYSTENIEVKTDLNDSQIKSITKGLLYKDYFKCDLMGELCNKMMVLSVSKNRQGRKEFKEIAQGLQSPPELEPLTIRERLIGK